MIRTVTVFIAFVFSFCFCVNLIAAEANKEITVFGVTLGKTFAASGMRECKIKDYSPTSGSKNYDSADTDCYKHTMFGQTACLTYIEKQLSFYMQIHPIFAKKCDIESPIERIEAEYKSVDYDRVLSMVTSKYGKPQKTENISVSNKMGAKFNKIENIWNLNGNSIYLTNMYEKIDEGYLVIIDAKRVKRELNKSIQNRQSDQQKF